MPVDTGLTPTLTVASAPSSPHRLLADARCALLAAVSLRPSTWSCTAGEVPSHAFLFFPNSADRPWHCHCYVSCCPDELTMTRRFLPLAFNFLFLFLSGLSCSCWWIAGQAKMHEGCLDRTNSTLQRKFISLQTESRYVRTPSIPSSVRPGPASTCRDA